LLAQRQNDVRFEPDERIDGLFAGVAHGRLHGDDGAGAQIDGRLVDGEAAVVRRGWPVRCLPVGHSIQSPLGSQTFSVARPLALSPGAVTGAASIWSPKRYSLFAVVGFGASG
jgi:hypothetical protein